MTQALINLVGTWGYIAIFVTMVGESAGLPISSEIVVPLGGALASQGKLGLGGPVIELVLVVLVSTLANLTGSLIAFWLTRRFGERVVLSRAGRRLGLSRWERVKGTLGRCFANKSPTRCSDSRISHSPLEFLRGTRARKALGASSWPAAFSSLVGRNRRRYGGYIVHAAIVVLALGIAGGAYGSTKVRELKPGQSMSIGGYHLTYLDAVGRKGPNRTEIRARVAVSRGGKNLGVYMAGKNQYPAEGQTSNEVGIRTDWLRAEDLFLIGEQFNPQTKLNPTGSVVLKVLVNPLVDLVWLAGFVFLFGSLIAMWPDEIEQRRLARRTEPVPATT